MGAPLQVGALVVRTLSQLWHKPVVPVNHCVARMSFFFLSFLFFLSLIFAYLLSLSLSHTHTHITYIILFVS
jgi:tRNA A37 threonylcarbamoyltransferase TsaD